VVWFFTFSSLCRPNQDDVVLAELPQGTAKPALIFAVPIMCCSLDAKPALMGIFDREFTGNSLA
jgi:hypothetical protein